MVRSLFLYARIALLTSYLKVLFFVVIQNKISEAKKVVPSLSNKEESYDYINNNDNDNDNE